jgi:hypothetical protein
MNAAVMAHGLTTGGRQGAREALEGFWHGVVRVSAVAVYRMSRRAKPRSTRGCPIDASLGTQSILNNHP